MMDPLDSDPVSPPVTPDQKPPYDPEKLAGEIRRCYTEWKGYREPHERDWFVNAAMLRGQQHVVYDQTQAQLVAPDAPSYAVRIDLNKILPKHRGRMAKFFKNRPKPVVIPASAEYQDVMDARASERALNYQWARLRLESAYRDARQWAAVGSKSFWWLGYDETVTGRVQMQDPRTGQPIVEDAILGDVVVEVGNVWEVLVKDPSIARVGQQPEILRVRSIPRSEAERRHPELTQAKDEGVRTGETGTLKQTEDSISTLTASDSDGGGAGIKRKDHVLLLEHYMAPCGKYPKGRKVVVCADTVVRYEEELPFEFWRSPANPYPCVEFSDTGNVGQFWNTTWIAQLVPLQRMLNRMLELIVENCEAVARPKILTYIQHQLADGAWTSSAGEIITLNWIPGLPEPRILQAVSVAGDVWNVVNLVLQQFDDVSQIHRTSEGGTGGAESGYQTNLLQEATDAVHAPDIRGDELAIEDAAWKIRRIMKITWDVPRLIAIGGEGSSAEMLEFSRDQIDDAAEVRIQIGSMLPDLKAAKAQTVLNYFKEGLLGDPHDPMVKRKALSMIGEYVGADMVDEKSRLDDDAAKRENQAILSAGDVRPAEFMQQHLIHIDTHEAMMKTPEWEMLDDESKLVGIAHVLTHYDFVNLPLAIALRQQYGLADLPIAAPPPPPPAPPAMAAPPPAPAAPGAPAPASLGPSA